MEWIKGYGWLEYNPVRQEIKKVRQADDWWLVVNVPGDICKYYTWWVLRQKGISLQLPVWRPHITVLPGRVPVKGANLSNWKKYKGEKIFFEYSNEIERNWKFWTVQVRSPRLQVIRQELGFDINNNLHLTIGREYETEPNLEIVKYGL